MVYSFYLMMNKTRGTPDLSEKNNKALKKPLFRLSNSFIIHGVNFYTSLCKPSHPFVVFFQTFPVETDLFLRENEKGLYCTSVYFLAKSLVGVIRCVYCPVSKMFVRSASRPFCLGARGILYRCFDSPTIYQFLDKFIDYFQVSSPPHINSV